MACSDNALSVRFLGTDSCTPTKGNNTASMVVDGRILIDTGWYLTDRLLASDIDPLAIEAVLLTHCHHDHIMGLPQLIFTYGIRRNARPDRPLHIFGPADEVGRVVADAQRYLQHDRYPELAFDIEVHNLAGGEGFELGDLRVAACAARHNVPGLHYRLDNATGASVAFSGDTAYNPALVELARGAGLLVHEASHGATATRATGAVGHSGAPDAADVAVEAGVGRLALVHCGQRAREAALAAAQAIFGDAFFPEEGEQIVVSGREEG